MTEFQPHDEWFMNLAISMARKCTSDNRRHTPMVGAVIAKGRELLAAAHRGESEHAEKLALAEIADGYDMKGTSVYTTLEPCTRHVRREDGESCTQRLIEARPDNVFVGMLDPNQGVCGKGVSELQLAGIQVILFPQEKVQEIGSMNSEFIIEQQGLGIEIDTPKIGWYLAFGNTSMTGSVKNPPTESNPAYVLVRKSGRWWPQGRLSVTGNRWTAGANIGHHEGEVTLCIVKANELGRALINYFHKIGDLHLKAKIEKQIQLPFPDYPSIDMNSLPKGLDLQASVEVFASKRLSENQDLP